MAQFERWVTATTANYFEREISRGVIDLDDDWIEQCVTDPVTNKNVLVFQRHAEGGINYVCLSYWNEAKQWAERVRYRRLT